MLLAFEAVVDLVAHRAAGNGVRETAKLGGAHPDTVVRWSRVVGEGCARLLDRMLRDLRVHRLELAELHAWVQTKPRRLSADAPPEHGEVRGYVAQDAASRAVVTYALGKRGLETTQDFLRQLRERIIGQPMIKTDGDSGYLEAIARAYRDDVDLARGIQEHEIDRGARGPASKLARRRLRHAKSLPHLKADLALMIAFYNLVHVHSAIQRTPGHALGITDHPWSLSEFVTAALAEPEPTPLPLPSGVPSRSSPGEWRSRLTGAL